MKLDIWLPTATPMCSPEVLAAVGKEAEDRGFCTLWVGEHVVLFDEYEPVYPYADDGRLPAPPGTGLLEPFGALTYLAALTSTLRLGTAMCLLAQRNPVYVAKEVSTLDWLSDGRVDLGVGVGWQREEFEAVNTPWARRGARTDEYLAVLRTLWCDERSSFSGELFQLPDCRMEPKPRQSPHPPIHIGGESAAALRRVARLGRGWHTVNRLPDELAGPLTQLDRLLEAENRQRSELRVTVCPYFQTLDAARIEQYAEAGADAVAAMVFVGALDDVGPVFEALQPCLDRAELPAP